MEAIAIRLEAIALRLEAFALRLEAFAFRLEGKKGNTTVTIVRHLPYKAIWSAAFA